MNPKTYTADDLRELLRSKVGPGKQSQAAFARQHGIRTPTVSEFLSGGDCTKAIAAALGFEQVRVYVEKGEQS